MRDDQNTNKRWEEHNVLVDGLSEVLPLSLKVNEM